MNVGFQHRSDPETAVPWDLVRKILGNARIHNFHVTVLETDYVPGLVWTLKSQQVDHVRELPPKGNLVCWHICGAYSVRQRDLEVLGRETADIT